MMLNKHGYTLSKNNTTFSNYTKIIGQLYENNWPPNVGKAHLSEWSILRH